LEHLPHASIVYAYAYYQLVVRINTSKHGTTAEVVVEKLHVESGAHQNDFERLQTMQKFT